MGARPSKLSDSDVRWIRRVGYPRMTMNKIARLFGVSQGHIFDIVHYKRRQNVKDRE